MSKYTNIDRFTPWEVIIEDICKMNSEFEVNIKGADTEDIDLLEGLLDGGLLSEHRRFLELMGSSIGKLKIGSGDFSIEALKKVYDDETWYPPKDLVLVGVEQDEENGFDFCLSRREEDRGNVVRVWFIGDTEIDESEWKDESYYEALSLQSLVYSYSFDLYEVRNKKFIGVFVPDKNSMCLLDEVEQFLFDNGMNKLTLNDAWNNFYVSENSAVVFSKPEGRSYQLLFGTESEALLNEFSNRIKYIFNINLVATV